MNQSKNSFFRNFLIFERDEPGFGNGLEPSGYIKLEGREEKVKLYANLQNLKEEPGKLSYKLYLLHSTTEQTKSIEVGSLDVRKGRAELRAEYERNNIEGTGLSIQDFSIAALQALHVQDTGSQPVFPLVAYQGAKVSWKEKFKKQKNDSAISDTKTREFEEEILKKDFGERIQIQNEIQQQVQEIKPPQEFQCLHGAPLQGGNPCENCYAKRFHRPDILPEQDIVQNMEKLKKSFDKVFKVFDPFNSKRKDYTWWRVDNPVGLNNALYQCGIKTPLLFNPVVMMAHFKFQHLAAGIYSDGSKKSEYLVCGVPGVFGIDTKPFGDFCKWVQLEGEAYKYGAFGYWVIYIDPKTGRFLSIS